MPEKHYWVTYADCGRLFNHSGAPTSLLSLRLLDRWIHLEVEVVRLPKCGSTGPIGGCWVRRAGRTGVHTRNFRSAEKPRFVRRGHVCGHDRPHFAAIVSLLP